MSDYIEGHVKRDPATGAIALRTNQPESLTPGSFGVVQAWLVSTTFSGAHYVGTEVVAEWDDIYTPEPPANPEEPVVVPPQ